MANQQQGFHVEQGADRAVVASGGSLDVASGGEIDIESGGALKVATVDVTSSLSGLKNVTVTAANGGANQVDVTIQVVDPGGTSVSEATLLYVWLSDLANGTGGSAHTHSTGPAWGTGEEVVEHITNDAWHVLTDENGTAVLNLIDTANEDVTINVQAPDGGLVQDTTVAGDWSA